MIFLSSLPRSGSTLLTSLLNQRPDTYASPTSNLCDTMGAAIASWDSNPMTVAAGGEKADLMRILKGIMDSRYDKPGKLVFDKGRDWASPGVIKTLSLIQDVKIVATIRPIAECVASFVKVAKPDNLELFCTQSPLIQHLYHAHNTLKAGYEAHPDKFLLIHYDDLVKDPQGEMDRIAEFVGSDKWVHDFSNVPDSGEEDKAWGISDLHKVRKKVSKRRYSAKKVLGSKWWRFFQGGEFWHDAPPAETRPTPLMLQCEALMRGDFEKSKQMAYRLLKRQPDNPDVQFNCGYFKLSEGKVSEGYILLNAGRSTKIWGAPDFVPARPLWAGEQGTVLLYLERGLGDQIHQVRYARDLKDRGCKVIVCCKAPLAETMAKADGADFVIQHRAAPGVMYDYWMPGQSAPLALGYEQADIRGDAYVKRPDVEVVPGRIGIRWQGEPAYEQDMKRLFPPQLLFNAVEGRECISLQRDEGAEHRPDWVEEVPLDTWDDTCKAIASCELVISSCTSISHMAGALGTPIWNIVPLVPYYLWAFPGTGTPYYNSMTLFRQIKFSNWDAPFRQLAEKLERKEYDRLRTY
jgi:hypothetical protein